MTSLARRNLQEQQPLEDDGLFYGIIPCADCGGTGRAYLDNGPSGRTLPCEWCDGEGRIIEQRSAANMSDIRYIVKHPRTGMFLAKKERPKNIRMGAGFGQDYRWVWKIEEAEHFTCYSEAELPGIFLRLAHVEIRPLLSCGLLGDPVHRDVALANGSFHLSSPAKAREQGL